MEKVCFVCLKPSRLKCSRCSSIQYCSITCQKSDWKTHKQNCNECNDEFNDELLWGKANNYIQQGNFIKAEKIVLKLTDKYQNQVTDDNDNNNNNRGLAIAHMCILAKTYESCGKYIEAEKLHINCYDYYMHKLGPNQAKTLVSMNYLGFCYLCQKKINLAEVIFKDCLERYLLTFSEDHKEVIMVMNFIGECNAMRSNYIDAEIIFKNCYNKAVRILGKSNDIDINIYVNIYGYGI
jgi:tetratricopeptide (TPR) repeat protein